MNNPAMQYHMQTNIMSSFISDQFSPQRKQYEDMQQAQEIVNMFQSYH